MEIKKTILKILSCSLILATLVGCNNNEQANTSITNSIPDTADAFFNKGLEGLATNGTYKWLGLRYTNDFNRFEQSIESSSFNYDDDSNEYKTYKTYSYQNAKEYYSSSPGEDCLRLNIFAPTTIKSDNLLPVYIHFHGGNFIEGTSNDALYDGSYLAKKGIIVVTVDSRESAFGYIENGMSNNGLNDKINALRFVKNHISTFGGDPENITVGGDGTGSIAVSAFFYCDGAKDGDGYLFKRAIINEQTILNTKYFKGTTSTKSFSDTFKTNIDITSSETNAHDIYSEFVKEVAERKIQPCYPYFDNTVINFNGDCLDPFSNLDESTEILLGYSTSYVKHFLDSYNIDKNSLALDLGTTSEALESEIQQKGQLAPLYQIAKKAGNQSYFYIIDDDNSKAQTSLDGTKRFISNETPLIFNNWSSLLNIEQKDFSLGDKFSDMYTNFIKGFNQNSKRSTTMDFFKFSDENKYLSINGDSTIESKSFESENTDNLEKGQ